MAAGVGALVSVAAISVAEGGVTSPVGNAVSACELAGVSVTTGLTLLSFTPQAANAAVNAIATAIVNILLPLFISNSPVTVFTHLVNSKKFTFIIPLSR